MSYHEIAKSMIDRLPEDKMIFVINMLEGLDEMSGLDLYPDFKPNAETIAAIEELENGGGTVFTGSTEDLFKQLMED
ncbi:MAG: hypothetical protein HFI16_04585 [Lachnospiraceae bacterium]|nr:hypothetical protein [Lachnospiraceae bacterium]